MSEHGLVPGRAASGFRGAVGPIVGALQAVGISPDAVSLAGLAFTVAGAALLASGNVGGAFALLVAGMAADTLDGELARRSGRATTWGAFLDSTLDRVGDGLVFGAVAFLGFRVGDTATVAIGLWALVASYLVSYVRAKAESLSLDATVGVAPREARSVLVLAGLAVSWLVADFAPLVGLVAAIAALSTITTLQRVVHVAGQRTEKGR